MFICSQASLAASEENRLANDLYEDIHLQEQKKWADKIEAEHLNYNKINHDFFSTERWRIYNNSAYSTSIQNQEQLKEIKEDDFSLSLGYGLEYRVDAEQKLGYEYRSNFPDKHGEMVRFFWNKSF